MEGDREVVENEKESNFLVALSHSKIPIHLTSKKYCFLIPSL
jgi:hypothetical protein